MIENLPDYITVIFILTTLATLSFFYFAVSGSMIDHAKSKAGFIILFMILWLILQAVLSYIGYYQNTKGFPPKFIFATFPPLLVIVFIFLTYEGKLFIDNMSLTLITHLNIVRIPVELVLYWLFLNKAIPHLMTFEGRNFDILAGITAPFIAYFGITRQMLSRKFILIWNYICLLLLLNIIVNAVLSAPFPFQQFAFDQPNIAVLYFPFIWLPSFIVPTVLFGHLVSIRRLRKAS